MVLDLYPSTLNIYKYQLVIIIITITFDSSMECTKLLFVATESVDCACVGVQEVSLFFKKSKK